jgi:hypothetical protein
LATGATNDKEDVVWERNRPSDRPGKGPKTLNEKKIDKLTRQVAKLASTVAQSSVANVKDSDEESDDGASSKKGNRNNAALPR